MIDEIIKYLDMDYSGDGYRIKEFSNNIYFGKDANSNYVFARINSTNENRFSIATKIISMYQNTEFEFISDDNNVIEDKFDVLILNTAYKKTLDTFVNLCLNFYSTPNNKSILELTEDLIELYKMVGTGDYSSQEGFWAEMFTIIYLYDNYGINIAKLTDVVKIETKSTIKEYREHTFSHEQVYTDNKVYISSILMRKDDQGKTIEDLFKMVKGLLNENYDVLKMLEIEMSKYINTSYLKFDYAYAINNIKFFLNSDVPKFEQEEPDGVHGTTYTIQLENVVELDDSQIKNMLKQS